MNLDLFSQFSTPYLLGIPLIILAILMPWIFFPSQSNHWVTNRYQTLQLWFTVNFSKQIFMPLKTKAQKWVIILASLMISLLGFNMIGLYPYTLTPSTSLAMNLGLATPMWLATVIVGLINQPSHSISHMLPEGTPTPLNPILIIIETISLLIRPLALGVRLTANLTAGHLLISLMSQTILNLPWLSASYLIFFTMMLLILLEIAVAIIQAYVFVLLLSLYLQENT